MILGSLGIIIYHKSNVLAKKLSLQTTLRNTSKTKIVRFEIKSMKILMIKDLVKKKGKPFIKRYLVLLKILELIFVIELLFNFSVSSLLKHVESNKTLLLLKRIFVIFQYKYK